MTGEVDFKALRKALQDLAKDFRIRYRENLEESDRIASKDLYNSIKTKVKVGQGYYEVVMDLAAYWKYVEEDTRPHWPPRDKILSWIQVKPIIPYPGIDGRVPTQEQLAFLISRKIATEGTEGSHDLRKTKDEIIPWYRERIEEALGRDMYDYILAEFDFDGKK